MGSLIKKQIHFLLLMADTHTSQKQKQAVLNTINKHQVNAISELALNIIKGTFTLNEQHKTRLRRHAKSLRVLAERRNTITVRRGVITLQLVEAVLALCISFLQQVNSDTSA